jgi:hypothetical protein
MSPNILSHVSKNIPLTLEDIPKKIRLGSLLHAHKIASHNPICLKNIYLHLGAKNIQ